MYIWVELMSITFRVAGLTVMPNICDVRVASQKKKVRRQAFSQLLKKHDTVPSWNCHRILYFWIIAILARQKKTQCVCQTRVLIALNSVLKTDTIARNTYLNLDWR